MKNNGIIEYKDNLIMKIKRIFSKITGKLKVEKNKYVEQRIQYEDNNDRSKFKESIIIKQDEEELRILKLQRDYKEGNILEQDMAKEDHKKLIELYKHQNKLLKEKLRNELNQLHKLLKDYN